MKSLVGSYIVKLLQTAPVSCEVILEEFGEGEWVDLVIKLEDGRLIVLREYDYDEFQGDQELLEPVQLTQENYSPEVIEGQKVISLVDSDGDFALGLENGLFVSCLGAPGGNYPWIYE